MSPGQSLRVLQFYDCSIARYLRYIVSPKLLIKIAIGGTLLIQQQR